MAEYQGPPWARAPPRPPPGESSSPSVSTSSWKLLEVKSGVQMAEHLLDKPYTVLGRAEDQVDIVLAHESCSRQHARIAFDKSGTVWLRDLGSTHGTTVNKKTLPPESCGRNESNSTKPGSRGVVLYPGDVIQFGASTRVFCVDGPRDVIRRPKNLLPAPATTVVAAATSNNETDQRVQSESGVTRDEQEGVSWGIYGDEEEDEHNTTLDDAATPSIDLREEMIPPQHRKAWERIQALQYKLDNLEIESSRIRRKGEDDLSQGQQHQLQRNEMRSAQLRQEIDTRRLELWHKIHPNTQATSKRRYQMNSNPDDVEDEVEDRTGGQSAIEFDELGESEETLLQKHSSLVERLKSVNTGLTHSREQVASIESRVLRLKATGNEEDAFYALNDLDIANEKVRKLKAECSTVEEALGETRRMLKVVNPKWVDPTALSNNDEGECKSQSTMMVPPPPRILKPSDHMGPPAPRVDFRATRKTIAPPPASSPELDPTEPNVDGMSSSFPVPKRKRVLGPSGPFPYNIPEKELHVRTISEMPTSKPPTEPRASSGALGVGGAIAALVAETHGQRPQFTSTPTSKEDLLTYKSVGSVSTLGATDLHEDAWKPPKDQDGSGFTKLNAKFSGRY